MSVMTQVLDAFDDLIHSGDPNIRQWPMINNIQSPALTVFTYVMFVKVVGPALMKDRKPFKPLLLMSIYNFGLVVFYAYFLLMSLYLFAKFRMACLCGTLDTTTTPYGKEFARLAWQLYIVKYLEMLDTVFLVLSKKFQNVSKLHVVHHAVVPVFAWTVLRSERRAYLSVFIFINSVVHTVMYVYYGLALFGTRFQKYLWWKKYLTAIQILQFLFVSFYMMFMYAIGCASAKATLAFAMSISILFLVLFINFYKTNYTIQEKSTKKNSAETTCNGHSKPIRNGKINGHSKPIENGLINGGSKLVRNEVQNGSFNKVRNGDAKETSKKAE